MIVEVGVLDLCLRKAVNPYSEASMKSRFVAIALATLLLFVFLPINHAADAGQKQVLPGDTCYTSGYVMSARTVVSLERGIERTQAEFRLHDWKWSSSKQSYLFVYVATVFTDRTSYIQTLQSAHGREDYVVVESLASTPAPGIKGRCQAWIFNPKAINIHTPFPEQDTDDRG